MAVMRAEHAATIETDFEQLIDGDLVGSERSIEVINPATGRVFARCPAATRPQLDRAVAAARRAFAEWCATHPQYPTWQSAWHAYLADKEPEE